MKANYSPEIDTIEIFFSPSKALQRMEGIFAMNGIKNGSTSTTFQPQRESWATAVFLLGYCELTHQKYWLRENPVKNESPDIFAISFKEPEDKEQKGITREIIEIEVCEYDNHAKTNLTEHIKEKLKNQAYNKETFLLCYIHSRPGDEIRLIDVMNELKDIKTTVREIWLLFHTMNDGEGNFIISRVYLREANFKVTNLNYKGNYIELSKKSQVDMVKTSKGISKKIEFKKLGYAIVPLPRDSKKNG